MMTTASENNQTEIRQTLQEIFTRASMDDLPAMSSHVRELISVINSNRATAGELTDAILKDFSLTNKILQVANSAFYNRGVPVNSISRAVTVIGFNTVRELAMAIAIFEEFIQAGEDKEELSRMLTMSFLAAMQVKSLAERKKLDIPMEDGFICGLLHRLGNIVVLVYLPELYHEIIALMKDGLSEKKAASSVLNGLTLNQVGQELARVWNFSDHIIATMDPNPRHPKNPRDSDAILHNLVVYCNGVTAAICRGHCFNRVLNEFRQLITMDRLEAINLVEKSVKVSEDTSPSIRKGLDLLRIHSRLQEARTMQ